MTTDTSAAHAMLNAFASVGATAFDVTLLDIEGREQGYQSNRSLDELKRSMSKRLPELEPEDYERIRQKWAEKGAKELRKAGFALEADRYAEGWRKLEQQRQAALERGDLAHAETLKREATKHRGPAADALERKGQQTERGDIHRDTDQRNEQARANNAALKIELAEIQNAIARHEREWSDAVAKAAIEKEKIERRFVEPKPERGALAGGQDTAPEATRDHRPEAAPEELKGTTAAIWLAHHSSDSARSFAVALAEKGIAVAITTKEDAEKSRTAAAAAQEKGSYAPVYRVGEIVAVTDRATVYRLNESTTGSKFADMQRYMRTLDTSQLRGIEAAKQMMHDRAAERGGRGLSNISGPGIHEQEVLDRAERRTMENERAARTRETQRMVLDRATRRTMENERAAGPRNTRDS